MNAVSIMNKSGFWCWSPIEAGWGWEILGIFIIARYDPQLCPCSSLWYVHEMSHLFSCRSLHTVLSLSKSITAETCVWDLLEEVFGDGFWGGNSLKSWLNEILSFATNSELEIPEDFFCRAYQASPQRMSHPQSTEHEIMSTRPLKAPSDWSGGDQIELQHTANPFQVEFLSARPCFYLPGVNETLPREIHLADWLLLSNGGSALESPLTLSSAFRTVTGTLQ